MTEPLYRDDAYAAEAPGLVAGHTDRGGVVLAASLFYPTGGGQPGDTGRLTWDGGDMPVGAEVTQTLDWQTRHRHMRMHTALHLLSVVLPYPVTGGAVGAEKSRLDFAMEDPLEDRAAIEDALNALIARDLDVTADWSTDAELEANPGLVKTMSVAPPKGAGRVRLIRIGTADEQVDMQPCGGTHVRATAEIGRVRLGKIEKKGRLNRRVNIHLDD